MSSPKGTSNNQAELIAFQEAKRKEAERRALEEKLLLASRQGRAATMFSVLDEDRANRAGTIIRTAAQAGTNRSVF